MVTKEKHLSDLFGELEDHVYLALEGKDGQRFFLVVEDGVTYYLSRNTKLVKKMTEVELLHICISLSKGLYTSTGAGRYGLSLFKNIEKKEVV